VRRANNLSPSCADCLEILEASTSWSPKGSSKACNGIAWPTVRSYDFKISIKICSKLIEARNLNEAECMSLYRIYFFCLRRSLTRAYAASCLTFLDHTHLVGPLRKGDQHIAQAATYTSRNKHERRTLVSSAGFEPAIPIIERPQTYASDRTTTGIGMAEISKVYESVFA
jgi:hypothetical protein